ncbi:MAG: SanA/YdcF family protein [Anaerolineales bacterium]
MKFLLRLLLGSFTLAGLALVLPRLYTALRYTDAILEATAAPSRPLAVVFGAGLQRDGGPTPVLYDRVATAVELYRLGKVQTLLMSGDGLTNAEPSAMRQTALELGVPPEAILTDERGLDTYTSCYRAQVKFGASEVLLVTQEFHLPRALFICEALGLTASGVSSDRRTYRNSSLAFWNVREVLATANAWWEVYVTKPAPEE